MKVIIFGAGPIGLYTAIKLKKKGVSDIIVCDPRLGKYVRLGDLERGVFKIAKKELNEGEMYWYSTKAPHIKNFERKLYSIGLRLDITFKSKQFLKFGNNKSVIIANTDKQDEEEFPCDYIFDCTGSKRAIVQAVNQQVQKDVFGLSLVHPNIRIKNHLIAYVGLYEGSELNPSTRRNRNNTLTNNISEYKDAFEDLKNLGWKNLMLPFCYVKEITEDRCCIYTEAPDELPNNEKAMTEWLWAVIESTVPKNKNICIAELDPSKNSHPRFAMFSVNPQQLQSSYYESENLPTVIVQGDAQIEPNYRLAHGVKNGLKRVNDMVDCLDIKEGKIIAFNKEVYNSKMKQSLEVHTDQIVNLYKSQNVELWEGLYSLSEELENFEAKNEKMDERTQELKNRVATESYNQALEIFSHISVNKIQLNNKKGINEAMSIVDEIRNGIRLFQTSIKHAQKNIDNVVDATEKQIKLIENIVFLADKLAEAKEFFLAVDYYELAVRYYKESKEDKSKSIDHIYAKIVLICNHRENPESALKIAIEALEKNTGGDIISKRKILFHAIKSVSKSVEKENKSKSIDDNAKNALKIYEDHPNLISSYLEGVLQKDLDKIKKYLEISENSLEINPSGKSSF